MTFRLDDSRSGVQVYQLIKSLNKIEIVNLIKAIEKDLEGGKSKIILDFSKEAATGVQGFGYIQKELSKLRVLAQKMQGEILYVLPQKISDRTEGTLGDLNFALQIIATGTTTDEKEKAFARLKEHSIAQATQISKLSTIVQILLKKNKELLEQIGSPSTDAELKAAVEHYRNLASEVQIASPRK